MKKISIIFSLLLAAYTGSLHAQTCSTGFCPATITVHHKAGSVSPVTGDITYPVVTSAITGTTACWIAQNLGATAYPGSYTDATVAALGWYWQFGRPQGYKFVSNVLTPGTGWTAANTLSANWSASNDPCTLLLGSTWRIPTNAEWSTAITGKLYNHSTLSPLHFAVSGNVTTAGNAYNQAPGTDTYSSWHSSTIVNASYSYVASFYNAASAGVMMNSNGWNSTMGLSVRCLRTY